MMHKGTELNELTFSYICNYCVYVEFTSNCSITKTPYAYLSIIDHKIKRFLSVLKKKYLCKMYEILLLYVV